MSSLKSENIVFWTARILGILFFVFVAFFVVAHAISPEGLPLVWQQPTHVQLEFLALFLMAFGGIVGWKWSGAAAGIILVSYAFWQLVERRLPWPPSFIEIPLATGLLYAFAWWSAKPPINQGAAGNSPG